MVQTSFTKYCLANYFWLTAIIWSKVFVSFILWLMQTLFLTTNVQWTLVESVQQPLWHQCRSIPAFQCYCTQCTDAVPKCPGARVQRPVITRIPDGSIHFESLKQQYGTTGAMITNSWSHRRLPMITAASPLVGVISDIIWPHLAMITAAVIAAAVQLWPLTITPITDPNHNPKP